MSQIAYRQRLRDANRMSQAVTTPNLTAGDAMQRVTIKQQQPVQPVPVATPPVGGNVVSVPPVAEVPLETPQAYAWPPEQYTEAYPEVLAEEPAADEPAVEEPAADATPAEAPPMPAEATPAVDLEPPRAEPAPDETEPAARPDISTLTNFSSLL
jgi:hypothetical protein